MILVDTSVWIDHLRRGEAGLAARLVEGVVLIHPLIIEELACGRLSPRPEILTLLGVLPRAPVASHAEILAFIENEGLDGAGVGALDVHLLASARLARAALWSRDKALAGVARRLGLGAGVEGG